MYSEYITATVLLLTPSHSNIISEVVWFFEGEKRSFISAIMSVNMYLLWAETNIYFFVSFIVPPVYYRL